MWLLTLRRALVYSSISSAAAWSAGRIVALGLAVLLGLSRPGTVQGQVGSTTDIITGTITNEQGQPMADAVVEATSLDTRVTRTAKTDAKGRYRILFPDGGGQYRVLARAIGVTPMQRTIARQADEDRLVINFKLSAGAVQLPEIAVRGRNGPPNANNQAGPGGTERVLSAEQLARLPVDASDFNAIAALAPGVVPIEGTDSTASGFSVAGLRPTSNVITLDGLTFGSASVPQDAIRSTRVITNSYDAARGQFSGAQIASTTRSGTNVLQGTMNYGYRDRSLEIETGEANAFALGYTQNQLSFGLGGPLKKDKLFVFGSAQGRLRSDGLQSLLGAPSGTLQRLGASPDSVARFLGLVQNSGVVDEAPGFNGDRSTDDLSMLFRMDYLLSETHTLMVRGDFRSNSQDPTRIGPLSLPATGGTQNSSSGGGMMTLSSRFGGTLINEARAYVSGGDQRSDPFSRLPQGRVQVASQLDDGSQGVSTLIFGGNSGLPQRSSNRNVELSEELSWLPGDGSHRIKVGGLYNSSRSNQAFTLNQYGTFTFNSLDALETGQPASFTRTLTPTAHSGKTLNGAMYLADTYRNESGFQMTYGARLETSAFDGAPANNQQVQAFFGRRTDQFPSEWHLSPRVGFSWTLGANEQGVPKFILRGGAGEFRSPTPVALLASAQSATGLAGSESQLICIGPSTPTPEWSAYTADPSTIPTTCNGTPTTLPSRNPSVTVFDPNFTSPRAWRGSLGLTRRIGLYALSAEASFARGVSQTGFRDLNLSPAPRFVLAGEGSRPVFAALNGIDPATGSVSLFGSRLHPELGSVLSTDSDLQSKSEQLVLSANGFTSKGVIFQVSYTFARSRDQSSFSGGSASRGFGAATTAGDPNVREWGTSDFERRHSFLATMTYPVGGSFEITTIARLTSGAPYTPMVNADINGDGQRNDRAFIANPVVVADSALSNGLHRLLAAGSSGAVSCLTAQFGTVAGRNSCSGPWQPSLDLQFNYRPNVLGLQRRLMVSLVTSNMVAGLDQLFHGAGNLHGWGQFVRPDPTLLFVRGFDPVTQRFLYTVNERFGSVGATANAYRVPFQIALQARYTIGPDRQREFLDGLRRGGGAGAAGGAGPAGQGQGGLASRFESMLPNPAAKILELKLGFRLDDSQVTKLTALSDSFTAHVKALAEQVRTEIEQAGPNPDGPRLFARIRPRLEAGREEYRRVLKVSQDILTKEQWGQVPESIRTPTFRIGGPGGGGQRPPA